jgi:hypothetical protein
MTEYFNPSQDYSVKELLSLRNAIGARIWRLRHFDLVNEGWQTVTPKMVALRLERDAVNKRLKEQRLLEGVTPEKIPADYQRHCKEQREAKEREERTRALTPEAEESLRQIHERIARNKARTPTPKLDAREPAQADMRDEYARRLQAIEEVNEDDMLDEDLSKLGI